jgi:uncharacterized PurR-regulated membrane protein YhhQ (DUF165 family)
MTRMRIPVGLMLAAGYVGSIVLANWLTNTYGLVAAGFGLLVTAGTYSAALALGLRDYLHETLGALAVLLAIAVGALVSASVSSAAIATASGVAFGLSELADMAIYTPLRVRGRRSALVASNAVGGFVDTVLFLWIAGFPVTGQSVGGQLLVKAVWVTGAFLLVDWAVGCAVSVRRVAT